MPEEATSEAYLPTQRPQAGEAARVPAPHVDARGASGDPQPPAEGPRSALGLTRMHGRANFLDVRHYGLRARSGAVGVSFLPCAEAAPARVGFAVGRRVGKAVVRNRVRRRLRASLSELVRLDSATLRGGCYVISAGPDSASLSFTELGAGLASALEASLMRADRVGVA